MKRNKEKNIRYLAQTIADMREALSERDEEIAKLMNEISQYRLELMMCQRDYLRLEKKAGALIPIKERRKEIFTK